MTGPARSTTSPPDTRASFVDRAHGQARFTTATWASEVHARLDALNAAGWSAPELLLLARQAAISLAAQAAMVAETLDGLDPERAASARELLINAATSAGETHASLVAARRFIEGRPS